MRFRFFCSVCCALCLAGCAPPEGKPLATVETAATLGLPAQPQPPISPQWWRALNDAKFDGLIDTALARSPDLAAAQARLRQAQAGADLADAQRGVKIGLGVSGALLHRDGVDEREKPELISDLEKRLLGDHGTNIRWCPKMYADKRRANKKQRRHGIFEVWKLKIPFAVPVAVGRI